MAVDTYEDCFSTPQWLYDALDREFHFALDAAATPESAKCASYITPEEDALKVNWKKRSGGKPIFLNAPFHRDILPEFVKKAYDESQTGVVIVCVLPYYKSYAWYRNYVNEYAEVRQIQGPVVFNGFGVKAGKHAGNVRGPQSLDTVIAIFRAGQKGFSGPYVDRPKKGPAHQPAVEAGAARALPLPGNGERKGGTRASGPRATTKPTELPPAAYGKIYR